MSRDSQLQPTEILRSLMQAANIASYSALSRKAEVSRWQIQQLRSGKTDNMRVATLGQIAAALAVSLTDLLQSFSDLEMSEPVSSKSVKPGVDISKSEPNQHHSMQTQALQTLETWLTQWPTIAKRAQEKGDELPAAKILPFVRPVEQLMAEWGVEPIATIDAQIPYEPRYHQLTKGTAAPGDLVQVTHTGHLHHGKLLHRAKVKPVR